MKKVILSCLFLLAALGMQAGVQVVENEPDNVLLFSYSHVDGAGGLKLAWSPDGNQWFSIGNGLSFVNSDFGPWGSMKRMFRPHLQQLRKDGSWQCIWMLTKDNTAMASVASPDLVTWHAQRYFTSDKVAAYEPKDVYPTKQQTVRINGSEQQGWTQLVPYAMVQRLIAHADQKAYRQQLIDETTAQDPQRFAGLKPVKATVKVDAAKAKPISTDFIGIFFEDINYAADGGLYAELVQNRDFEYSAADMAREKDWNATYAWTLKQAADGAATLSIATEAPIHENNPHYAVLDVKQPEASLQNGGFDGITLKKGDKYDFSLFARVPEGSKGGRVVVTLLDKEGNAVGSASVNVTSRNWKKLKAVVTATADVAAGSLALAPQKAGTYHLDMISLFPQKTFKGRKNGLRADLAQVLADMKPRFVRFPGGCVAHGDGLDNVYDWKGSIGPLEARKPLPNIWRYHQTRGLGYHEYFLFCEDLGAEAVPVLAAGVPCQNSGTHSHYSKDDVTRYGQQGGLPMEEMDAYIQDVLDLIEYANGDARKTEWGRKRAEAGHPKPFNLKYIGIGNEDMITEVFEERFRMIYDAVSKKHPEVTVIGTVGPFYEGTDYNEGWRLATELGVPMVDEHYYVAPGWMVHNQDYYDRYDRNKAKVYLGEYAAHLPGRPSNVETALAEALYLTSVERNADVVTMTSYAPLLAKEGHTQWRPDLIYFNNTEVKPTVDYYTQLMYGQNAGTHYLASEVQLDNRRDAVQKRFGVSVVKDDRTGDYIVRLVNMLPVEVTSNVQLEGVVLTNPTATKTLLSGSPEDSDVKPVVSDFAVKGNSFDYTLPAYSFTVIRIADQVVKTKK